MATLNCLFAGLTLCIMGVYGQVSVSHSASQVMQGIGASGAWWPISLYDYPESVREQAADLLFSQNNLALTSYRYNVGGGGVFVGNPQRAPETFYVSPGVYNWSADPQGVYFLKKAAAYGVPLITAFVNSAPPAFTTNHKSCDGQLSTAQIPAYAQYLADVISHWKSQGVIFTHVSPMNEPDDSFGSGETTPCGQEGMIVTPQQRAQVVNSLRSALDAAGLQSVGIIADESSSTGNFIPEAQTWIPSAKQGLAAVCHHQYGFANDATVQQMGDLARNLSGKQTWFTEICCYAAADSTSMSDPAAPLTYSGGYDPTMVGALQLGSLLHQSFTQTGDVHFDWWTALSNAIGCNSQGNNTCVTTYNSDGWNDGLVYFDENFASNSNFALYPIKRFFLLKHFSHFIPIGATRFNVTGLPSTVYGLAFKYAHPISQEFGSSRASLVLMNMGDSVTQVDISQAGMGNIQGSVVTTQEMDWTRQGISRRGKNVSLPGLSITSVLFG